MRAIVLTYLALVVLAALSWISADLGAGTAVALVIAAAKAGAIAMWFMELGHQHNVLRTIAAVAVVLIAIMCTGTLGDAAFR